MKFLGPLIFSVIFTIAPATGTIVSSGAGRPCATATVCTGGPWVNGYEDPGPGVGNFISQDPTETDPFNQFDGFDGDVIDFGENASFDWTFTYAALPGGATINSASLEIAFFDLDAAASGNQIASFTLDGFDLTVALNALIELAVINSGDGEEFEYNIYTLPLLGGVFADLTDGSVSAHLDFGGPGQVFFTGFGIVEVERNGGGIDYATLSIDYEEPLPGVPEPSTFSMLSLASLGGAAIWMRRRKLKK